MAEASMNAGNLPPQFPPGMAMANPNAGAGAGMMSPQGGATGMTAPNNALAGVTTGAVALRDKVDEFLKLPTVRRAGLPILILLILIVAVSMLQFGQTTSYRAIMPGMTENDKQAAIEALRAGDFKPKVDTTSGQITVPEARYHEARIFLAGQGIPKEAQPIGMDSLKDSSSMTTSQFMEQVQYNTAIEQELARSIMQISTIKSARVHLALPKQSVFVRERATPKASVVLTPHSGRGVTTPQVKAIVNLVSSSVPYLSPQNVSVVDDSGNLMTDENPVDAAMGLTVAQMLHKQRTEETYRNRVTELLAPVVGDTNVHSQVNITMDFTQVETTTEDFDNKDKGVKPRSEALTEERKTKLEPEGIPGALTNTPPPDVNLTDDTASNEKNPASNETVTTKSTRNFEMDRAVRHVKNSQGTIDRLSVAVVVNERMVRPPANGTPPPADAPTTTPYTAQELDRMLNLVRSAVGYNEARGDVVTVAPARFEPPAVDKPVQWYANSDIQNFIKIGIAALIIIVFLIAVVRPMVKGPTVQQIVPQLPPAVDEVKLAAEDDGEEEEGAEADEVEMQDGESLAELKARMQSMKPKKATFSADMLDTANSYDDKVALIRMLVSQESGRVAMVLKNMVKN